MTPRAKPIRMWALKDVDGNIEAVLVRETREEARWDKQRKSFPEDYKVIRVEVREIK